MILESLFFLVLLVGSSLAAPPPSPRLKPPTLTKRSFLTYQHGNVAVYLVFDDNSNDELFWNVQWCVGKGCTKFNNDRFDLSSTPKTIGRAVRLDTGVHDRIGSTFSLRMRACSGKQWYQCGYWSNVLTITDPRKP